MASSQRHPNYVPRITEALKKLEACTNGTKQSSARAASIVQDSIFPPIILKSPMGELHLMSSLHGALTSQYEKRGSVGRAVIQIVFAKQEHFKYLSKITSLAISLYSPTVLELVAHFIHMKSVGVAWYADPRREPPQKEPQSVVEQITRDMVRDFLLVCLEATRENIDNLHRLCPLFACFILTGFSEVMSPIVADSWVELEDEDEPDLDFDDFPVRGEGGMEEEDSANILAMADAVGCGSLRDALVSMVGIAIQWLKEPLIATESVRHYSASPSTKCAIPGLLCWSVLMELRLWTALSKEREAELRNLEDALRNTPHDEDGFQIVGAKSAPARDSIPENYDSLMKIIPKVSRMMPGLHLLLLQAIIDAAKDKVKPVTNYLTEDMFLDVLKALHALLEEDMSYLTETDVAVLEKLSSYDDATSGIKKEYSTGRNKLIQKALERFAQLLQISRSCVALSGALVHIPEFKKKLPENRLLDCVLSM